MRGNLKLGVALGALAAGCVGGAALAQTTQPSTTTQPASGAGSLIPSLVTVDLRNVLNNLAVDLKLDRANVPITAQVPINVAANVCGVSVNVLSVSTGGQAACTAKTGSVQLSQAVQQQMSAGGSTAGSQSGGAAGTGSGTAVGSLGGSTGATGTGGTTSTGMGSTNTTTPPAAGATSGTSAGTTTGTTAPATTTGGTTPRSTTGATSAPTTTTGGAAPRTGTAGATGTAAGGTTAPAAGTSGATTGQTGGSTTATQGGATTTAHSTTRGRSASAPGHVKKRAGAQSARDYAPGLTHSGC